jgi:biotin---protein ligase
MLVKLGLKVSVENGTNGTKENGIPALTPFHISSSSPSLNRAIYKSLLGIADNPQSQEGHPVTITETNDTFHIQFITSPLDSMRDLRQVLNGHYRSRSIDPNPKDIFLHPTPMTYPYFSMKEYFEYLPSSSKIGQTLAYVEVTTSTQTILDKNPVLLRNLPSGFVITSTSQLNGRGRAGNAWISPRGSLAFSYVIRLPRQLSSRLVFVQYLVSLAVVEGIRTYAPGWEDVNVSIKWPNDVYGKPRTSDRWEKIVGIMVNSTYMDNDYVLVVGTFIMLAVLTVGCGINTTNAHPTTSLLHIIPEELEHPTHERLLANILSTFSDMYDEFLETGFRTFEQKYYQRWLHEEQIVSIENGMTRGKIRGIDCKDGGSGGLLIDEVDISGRSLRRPMVEVIADGNSFDMMKGLLRRKR